MDKTLVVMAAGMGSRYGGNKQIDGMGPHNEALMLYSIYDAVKAGFTKVVFIIKHSFEAQFKAQIGDLVAKKVHVEYAYQELTDLPEGCTVPAERTKPLGTVQALLSAKELIHEPFAVINADDYYGVPGYGIMVEHLGKLAPEKQACMVGYYLKNTVSENGHVTRGVCKTDEHNHLVSVTETYKIKPFPDGTIRDTENDENGVILDPDALVSMNFFGFTPWLLQEAEKYFIKFMKKPVPRRDEGRICAARTGGSADARGRAEGRHAQDRCGLVWRDLQGRQALRPGRAEKDARRRRLPLPPLLSRGSAPAPRTARRCRAGCSGESWLAGVLPP